MIQSTLSSKDIFIHEIMLEAKERKIIVTRNEVETCVDFYMALGNYMNSDLILNALNLASVGMQ